MFRFDSPHEALPQPEIVTRISEEEVAIFLAALADRHTSLSDIALRLTRYPPLSRRILRMANSALTGAKEQITDPVHAVSLLGSRRLIEILSSLPADPAGGFRLPESDASSAAA